MRKLHLRGALCMILMSSLILLTSGCPALLVGGAAVGASSGTYFYVNGELKTDYPYSFDRVWTACEKTVAEARSTAVEPVKGISEGTINAKINSEPVKFTVKYKDKNLTTVGIRIGIMGDEKGSKLLHDKISAHLTRR